MIMAVMQDLKASIKYVINPAFFPSVRIVLVISLILFPKYCFMFTIFGMVTFGLVTKFSRYVSLGSITGIIGFFIEFVIWGLVGWLPLNNNEFIEASIVVLLFVILGVARHSGNIKRLINGTERKIGEKK